MEHLREVAELDGNTEIIFAKRGFLIAESAAQEGLCFGETICRHEDFGKGVERETGLGGGFSVGFLREPEDFFEKNFRFGQVAQKLLRIGDAEGHKAPLSGRGVFVGDGKGFLVGAEGFFVPAFAYLAVALLQ